MSDFKDVVSILNKTRTAGGGLASQGNDHFAGDWDEFPVDAGVRRDDIMWEIRLKSDTSKIYYYKDLMQFAREVKGSPVEMHGIERIASIQGYPRAVDHDFDIKPKVGTTGNVDDYEARLVKKDRSSFTELLPPRPRRDHTIANMHNYKEATGQ